MHFVIVYCAEMNIVMQADFFHLYVSVLLDAFPRVGLLGDMVADYSVA